MFLRVISLCFFPSVLIFSPVCLWPCCYNEFWNLRIVTCEIFPWTDIDSYFVSEFVPVEVVVKLSNCLWISFVNFWYFTCVWPNSVLRWNPNSTNFVDLNFAYVIYLCYCFVSICEIFPFSFFFFFVESRSFPCDIVLFFFYSLYIAVL